MSSRSGAVIAMVVVAVIAAVTMTTGYAQSAGARTAQAAAPSATSGAEGVADELKRITQELLDAVAPGHVDVWRRHLDERVIYVDENGAAKTKAELLADFRPLPAGLVGRIRVGAFKVEQYGDGLAVTTREDRESLNYHGQQIESTWRTTDTWRKTPDGWKLIAAQVHAQLVDPPSMALTRTQLCAYAGTYGLTADIATELRCEGDHLVSQRAGRPPAVYRPEVLDVFFAPGQPRTRRIFQRDAGGRVTGFVDRREGHDITWKRSS